MQLLSINDSSNTLKTGKCNLVFRLSENSLKTFEQAFIIQIYLKYWDINYKNGKRFTKLRCIVSETGEK